jgi:hypothetical protein
LDREIALDTAKQYDSMRFVGYVLDINYDTVTIITSDPFKLAVGGVPRNSLLIMTPSVQENISTPHFTLLRVLDAAPTPLSKDTQQSIMTPKNQTTKEGGSRVRIHIQIGGQDDRKETQATQCRVQIQGSVGGGQRE